MLTGGAFMLSFELRLDLHENTGGYDKTIERFDRAGRRLEDIDDALMRAHLELFAGLLVDMRAPKNRVSLDPCRHRNRPTNAGVSTLRMIHDFSCGRIE